MKEIKKAILELASLAMEIQEATNRLSLVNINHSIGTVEIFISHEYDRRLDTSNVLVNEVIYYGDDYNNETFFEKYQRIKNNLLQILLTEETQN